MTLANEPSRSDLALRHLRAGEIGGAAALLARGMRDTPMSVAVHGDRPDRRQRELEPIFAAFLSEMVASSLCATQRERLVGVAGLAAPGRCQDGAGWRAARALLAARVGPATAWRFRRWRRAWAAEDLPEPHLHLGPLAVEPALRGHGIGSRLMISACELADRAGAVLYLETDTDRNVRFYERWGFVVVSQRDVLARPNWFMRRSASV